MLDILFYYEQFSNAYKTFMSHTHDSAKVIVLSKNMYKNKNNNDLSR